MNRLSDLGRVCRKHGVALVYLFGSQALEGSRLLAGEEVYLNDPMADLDMGVVMEKPLPLASQRLAFYAAVYNDLVELVKPFLLDLVFLEETHSVFQLEAIKGICVYQTCADKRSEYEMMVLRRAADFRPFLERYLDEALEEFRS
ncbi:MAG: nucleotidyltransferase domain-containing protein [Bacillota bacterium]